MRTLLFLLGCTAVSAASWADCSGDAETKGGPFHPVKEHRELIDSENKTIYAVMPKGDGPFPVLVFMHGLAATYWIYQPLMHFYASHGFAVVFPFIHSPLVDKLIFITDTNGHAVDRGIVFAHSANLDKTSPLFGKLDTSNIVIAGHSAGATAVIMTAQRQGSERLKAVATMHPGICGPFGPPPRILNSTWMKQDLAHAMEKFPILFSTASNDGAFQPEPWTAKWEYGCYSGAWWEKKQRQFPSAFVQYSNKSCHVPGAPKLPKLIDGLIGHGCPCLPNSPETPWVLRHLKLYGQLQGKKDSKCFEMLWGHGQDSLRHAVTADKVDVHSEDPSTVVV